jgi:hypothetical protein
VFYVRSPVCGASHSNCRPMVPCIFALPSYPEPDLSAQIRALSSLKRLILMLRPTVKCPFCGATMSNRQYHAGKPWTCPGCSRQLEISQQYLLLTAGSALVLSAGVCFVAGLRGLSLLGGTLVLLIPIDLARIYLRNRVLPLRLTIYSGKDSSAIAPGPNVLPK